MLRDPEAMRDLKASSARLVQLDLQVRPDRPDRQDREATQGHRDRPARAGLFDVLSSVRSRKIEFR